MKYGALAFLFLSGEVLAQYSGPAVDACLAYAKREQKQNIVFERDQNLQLERYSRKLGRLFVSSILWGNGAAV